MVRKSLLRDLLIVLWFLSWTSVPDSEAVLSINSLDGYALAKILYRIAIVLIVLYLLVIDKTLSNGRNYLILFLPFIYVIVNVILLALSKNIFYSAYRLFEFTLIWLSAMVFIGNSTNHLDGFNRIPRLFIILSLVCFSLLFIYFILPDWGAKFSGFDHETGEAKLRLGGTLLRVDLVAVLGGCVLLFWFFFNGNLKSFFYKILGMLMGLGVVFFSHSRTAIFILLVLFVVPIFLKKNHVMGLFAIALMAVTALVLQEHVFVYIMRGSDVSEVSELNGRLALWSAAISNNTLSDLLIGNGYLMNTPEGMDFYVPEFGRYMNSTHNGYLTVLLGSGIVGIILIMLIYISLIKNLFRKNGLPSEYATPLMFVFVFMAIMTNMDYGIWGVTSPATLLFAIIYIVSFARTQSAT